MFIRLGGPQTNIAKFVGPPPGAAPALCSEERDTVHRFRKTVRAAVSFWPTPFTPPDRKPAPRTAASVWSSNVHASEARPAGGCLRACVLPAGPCAGSAPRPRHEFPCRHRRRFLCTGVERGGGARRKQSVPVEYRKLFVNSLACRPSAMAHASRSGNRLFQDRQELRMSIYGGYMHNSLTQKQPVFHHHQAPAEQESPLPTQPDKIPAELQK